MMDLELLPDGDLTEVCTSLIEFPYFINILFRLVRKE
jgi:hypothetical protein